MPRDWNAEERAHVDRVAAAQERVRALFGNSLDPDGFANDNLSTTAGAEIAKALEALRRAKDELDDFVDGRRLRDPAW
jgi:hypothetical protein